jgi:hypothetical protein
MTEAFELLQQRVQVSSTRRPPGDEHEIDISEPWTS